METVFLCSLIFELKGAGPHGVVIQPHPRGGGEISATGHDHPGKGRAVQTGTPMTCA